MKANDKKAIDENADKYMCFVNVILKKQQIVEWNINKLVTNSTSNRLKII